MFSRCHPYDPHSLLQETLTFYNNLCVGQSYLVWAGRAVDLFSGSVYRNTVQWFQEGVIALVRRTVVREGQLSYMAINGQISGIGITYRSRTWHVRTATECVSTLASCSSCKAMRAEICGCRSSLVVILYNRGWRRSTRWTAHWASLVATPDLSWSPSNHANWLCRVLQVHSSEAIGLSSGHVMYIA
jgi:hypothetical protein